MQHVAHNGRLRHRFRHARRLLGYGALVVLILAAAAVGAINQLLPLVERNPEKIAVWLSERVGQPLQFSAAHAEWTRRGPRFILSDLRVGGDGAALEIGGADLLVSVYSGLLPGSPLTELKVRDLSLELVQDADRRWRVLGLPASKKEPATDPLSVLETFGELQIERASLRVHTFDGRIDAVIPRVDLRLRVSGGRVIGGVRAWSKTRGKPLTAVADLQRKDWSGKVWAGGGKIALADWAELLAMTGIKPTGLGDVDVWVSVRQQQVTQVQTRLDVKDMQLQAREPWLQADDGTVPSSPATRFQRVRLGAHWQAGAHGWQVQFPTLQVRGREGVEANYDGLWMAGGEVFALRAKRLALAPVRALLPLSEQLPDGLRRWLYQAAPDGQLRDVEVMKLPDGRVRGKLRISDVSWQPAGTSPGASGLAGVVVFDEQGGILRLSRTPVVFDWPAGFGAALPISLQGSLGWWRDQQQWVIGSTGLRIDGDHFGASLRAQVHTRDAGQRPRLDLAAQLDDIDFAVAKRFWVRHRMSAATVHWLDTALVEGAVQHGRAALGGELGDWPFVPDRHLGRFDARADIRAARLKFNDHWPEAENLNLDVAFDGPGFTLEGSGSLLGNPVERVRGGIAEFKQPWLSLDIESHNRSEDLRRLLIASPLNNTLGEHLAALGIQGPTALALKLRLPLRAELGERVVTGQVDLDKVKLADSRWNIAFSKVSGQVDFDHTGFAANGLDVIFEGDRATLDLAAGKSFLDSALAFQANLRGVFPATTLLRQYASLAWLEPWLEGRSAWTVAVAVAQASQGKPAPPTRLSVSSDLQGTAITLPAPLFKPADEALPLQLTTALPLSRGELQLALGERMQLRGTLREGAPNLTGVIDLGGAGTRELPPEGLIVRGHPVRVDAAGWIGFAAHPCPASAVCADSAGTAAVNSVDIQADAMDLLGSSFTDVHLALLRQPSLTTVDLAGPGIAGRIEVPAELTRGIIGRLTRLYWPAKPADAGLAPLPLPDDEPDPASFPPLDFTVDDLRLGDARYGKAQFIASPVPRGLRVERFQTRSKPLTIDANGQWLRGENGQNSQSQFEIAFNARSLDDLVGGYGLSGMIRGGAIQGQLVGSWPGSPGGFELARFTGRMHAAVGEGQLLDVEPGGGGRVLGLLSLTELPRRLTLDFSDFFAKGFGFNAITGDFEFTDGRARTDNLNINGPAAEIRVSGLTDMREQSYQQRVEVLPKTGGMLPVLGAALAGGPVGVAVGAVAQAVFQRPLKKAGRTVYSISGPWKKPLIEVIESGPAPSASEPAPTKPALSSPQAPEPPAATDDQP